MRNSEPYNCGKRMEMDNGWRWRAEVFEVGKIENKKPWNSREYLSSSNKLADVRIWKAVARFQGKL
jgi:hypothetical protein